MSLDPQMDAAARRAQLPAALERQLVERLERGAAEYGDRSLSRPRAELLGEMLEEALDLIGWAVVIERAVARQNGESCAVAFRVRMAPVTAAAAVLATHLAADRDEALELATPTTEPTA